MGMKRQPINPRDPNYVPCLCEDCGFILQHPAVLRSIPLWCPRCIIMVPPVQKKES